MLKAVTLCSLHVGLHADHLPGQSECVCQTSPEWVPGRNEAVVSLSFSQGFQLPQTQTVRSGADGLKI